jgi:hypothetical protein
VPVADVWEDVADPVLVHLLELLSASGVEHLKALQKLRMLLSMERVIQVSLGDLSVGGEGHEQVLGEESVGSSNEGFGVVSEGSALEYQTCRS